MNDTRRSILIVEDEAIIAMEIKDRLESRGWDVCGIAVSGDDAIRLAAGNRPDAVLMDITLKGAIDGFEAARTIRKKLGIPVVFVTASLNSEIVKRMEREGSSLWVNKPFDEKELFSALDAATADKKMPLD